MTCPLNENTSIVIDTEGPVHGRVYNVLAIMQWTWIIAWINMGQHLSPLHNDKSTV